MLRLMIASPNDVTRERDLVETVLDDVNRSLCAERNLHIDAVRWEADAYPGFHPSGPQGLIDSVLRIDECDVLVGIFWKRFGTPTKDAGSGTEHEIRQALKTREVSGRPQVMVYFNQQPYAPSSKQETDQWGQVLAFQEDFPKEGLWWPYRGASQFGELFRRHLTNFILHTFPMRVSEPAKQSPPVVAGPARGDAYFSVQARIIEENTRAFVGRKNVSRQFEAFRKRNPKGYFLVRGGPGQGKTALACELVKSGGYVHHFISRTGGRDDARLTLRSLLAQMDGASQTGADISFSNLTKVFEETLAQVAARQAVIVIDGLDELPAAAADDPPYLPSDALPDGLHIIVTARPGDHLDRLRERLFAVPYELYELGPLDRAEMREIVSRRRPTLKDADLERIETAAQGNPLYLRAVTDQLDADPGYDLANLPGGIEGFFKSATRALNVGNKLLGDVLGILVVSRKPLSVEELSAITETPQRVVHETAIRAVQQFLLELDGGYTFYHASFHEFVRKSLLYEDELRESHRKIATWLERPENRDNPYRLHSLAHHLFESDDRDALFRSINAEFLMAAARRLNYSVLESLEVLTRALLERGDPTVIEQCVELVESLQPVFGSSIMAELAETLQPYRSGPETFRSRLIEPRLPAIPGIELYAGVLPKAEVPADFFEIAAIEERLLVAIGDAPSVGFKSAFVARFIANFFRDLVTRGKFRDLAALLTAVDSKIRGYDYFRRISMQCMALDQKRGVVRIANAGHPYPVHYVARRSKCDILPLPGDVLYSGVPGEPRPRSFEEFALEVAPGDLLVLITDGLTEAQILKGDPYGYRFTQIIESRSNDSARAIGRAILDAWRIHPREIDSGDDVTLVIMKIDSEGAAKTR